MISSSGTVPVGNGKVIIFLLFPKHVFTFSFSLSLITNNNQKKSHAMFVECLTCHTSTPGRSNPNPKPSTPKSQAQITVYAKTQHTTDSWLTVTPSPISCGFIDAATSPPALLPSSPPPETPSPTPSPTPPPAPPPMVNGIDPCCDSFCDFSACQPNGVIDATGGSMVIVYGTGLLDARSIRIGGRECISASSTNMLECRPSSNYGALADSQCQCISPPGAGKQPAEVRGGKFRPLGCKHPNVICHFLIGIFRREQGNNVDRCRGRHLRTGPRQYPRPHPPKACTLHHQTLQPTPGLYHFFETLNPRPNQIYDTSFKP